MRRKERGRSEGGTEGEKINDFIHELRSDKPKFACQF